MRLWESNSLVVTTQENPHHSGPFGFAQGRLRGTQGGTGESRPTSKLNRLQFPFHDSRGSFFCED
jgi:hypothetical protein